MPLNVCGSVYDRQALPTQALPTQAHQAAFSAPERGQGWTTLPALPVPLDLPLCVRTTSSPVGDDPAAPAVMWTPALGRPGVPAQAVSIEGQARVRLPEAAYLLTHLSLLRVVPMVTRQGRKVPLPEKFYQALRHEFFPPLLGFAGQTVGAEQIADIIVYAMHTFNENNCGSVNDTLTMLVPFLLAGLLPAGRPDLLAVAQARFEIIKAKF